MATFSAQLDNSYFSNVNPPRDERKEEYSPKTRPLNQKQQAEIRTICNTVAQNIFGTSEATIKKKMTALTAKKEQDNIFQTVIDEFQRNSDNQTIMCLDYLYKQVLESIKRNSSQEFSLLHVTLIPFVSDVKKQIDQIAPYFLKDLFIEAEQANARNHTKHDLLARLKELSSQELELFYSLCGKIYSLCGKNSKNANSSKENFTESSFKIVEGIFSFLATLPKSEYQPTLNVFQNTATKLLETKLKKDKELEAEEIAGILEDEVETEESEGFILV